MNRENKEKISNYTVPSRSLPPAISLSVLEDAGSMANSDMAGAFASKRERALQVVELEDRGRRYLLAVATGAGPEKPWEFIDGSSCKPSYKGNKPVTRPHSDTQVDLNIPEAPIASLCLMAVSSEALADSQHVINRRDYSGKRVGTLVLVTSPEGKVQCAFATESADTSPWFLTDGSLVSPSEKDPDFDYQRERDYVAQVSGDFDIFPAEQLLYTEQSDFWNVADNNPEGSTVIAYTTQGGQPSLLLMHLAVSDGGEYVWYDLAGVAANDIKTGYFTNP